MTRWLLLHLSQKTSSCELDIVAPLDLTRFLEVRLRAIIIEEMNIVDMSD